LVVAVRGVLVPSPVPVPVPRPLAELVLVPVRIGLPLMEVSLMCPLLYSRSPTVPLVPSEATTLQVKVVLALAAMLLGQLTDFGVGVSSPEIALSGLLSLSPTEIEALHAVTLMAAIALAHIATRCVVLDIPVLLVVPRADFFDGA